MNSLVIAAVCFLGFALNCSAQSGCNMSEHRAHPTNCSIFMTCVGSGWVEQDCAPSTVFNPSISRCDYRFNVPSCTEARMCNGVAICPAGQVCQEDPDQSTKGYKCVENPNVNACASNPCVNGRQCVNMIVVASGYVCVFGNGGGGGVVPRNVCNPNPCRNGGTCSLSQTGSYQCACQQGWYGQQCQFS